MTRASASPWNTQKRIYPFISKEIKVSDTQLGKPWPFFKLSITANWSFTYLGITKNTRKVVLFDQTAFSGPGRLYNRNKTRHFKFRNLPTWWLPCSLQGIHIGASFCLRNISDFPRNGCLQVCCQSSGKSLVAHPSWEFMSANPATFQIILYPLDPACSQDGTKSLPYNERDHRWFGWCESPTQFDQESHRSSPQGTFQYYRLSLEAS